MLSGAAWQSVKSVEAIKPAGHIFPTHTDNLLAHEKADETVGMVQVREYAQTLARLLLEVEIDVEFCQQPTREVASWGSRLLSFNVRNLGKRWFDLAENRESIDDLIVHEFGHHYVSNHLSEK